MSEVFEIIWYFLSYSFLFDQIFWKCCGLRNTVCSKKDDASMLVYNDIRLSLHASWSEFLSLCFITFLKWTTAILKLIKSDKDATNEETINDLDIYMYIMWEASKYYILLHGLSILKYVSKIHRVIWYIMKTLQM